MSDEPPEMLELQFATIQETVASFTPVEEISYQNVLSKDDTKLKEGQHDGHKQYFLQKNLMEM